MRTFSRLVSGLSAATLACSLAGAQTPPPKAPEAPASPTLALTGGTVIDVSNWGDSAHDIPEAVVLVRDGRITEVGQEGSVQIPKDARILDCTGKYLIPGLVDGFAGINSQSQANANLYMGVTTVAVRGDAKRGPIDYQANPRPHLYLIDSIGTTDNWSLLAHQPAWAPILREGTHPVELSPQDTARQLLATARLGTRVLLLGPDITAANAQWIISRAHQMGIATYGQFVSTPYRVAIDAGVDVLLHMGSYELGVIPDELQQPLVTNPYGSAANTAHDYSVHIPPTDLHLNTYARFIAKHHAALMPTFSQYYVQLPGHRNLWKEPAATLLSPGNMDQPTDPATGELTWPLPTWARHLPGMAQRWMEANLQKKADQEALLLWHINQTIYAANPHYLAASGASTMGSMAGISLQTELEMLVRLGLSPREALAAATNNYALQLGWTELGLIAPGRRADIVVLDADPTLNIWNTQRISTLLLDGNIVDRNALLRLRR